MEQINETGRPLRVALLCTGIEDQKGGIETFFYECSRGLQGAEGIELMLCKGPGDAQKGEVSIPCLLRNHQLAKFLGVLLHRNSYIIEQISAFPFFALFVRRWKPDIIFYSDSNHGFLLYRWRKWLGVDYKLLFSNGGPCKPPFSRTDFVHQVAPLYNDIALAAGESSAKHILVPYGINLPEKGPFICEGDKKALRTKLGLPQNQRVLVSVGWISATHKRMDYVIREIAALGSNRPHLAMVGRMDETTPPILALARELLGESGFTAVSVPYEQVAEFYQAADVFVLASLFEGFGRVFLEALGYGLPCLIHDHPVMHYVLGEEGCYGDFSQPGVLGRLYRQTEQHPLREEDQIRRYKMVQDRFGWASLRSDYVRMFQHVAATPIQ